MCVATLGVARTGLSFAMAVLATIAPIVAVVGTFFGRMAFYGVEMSVGLFVGL